jgi:hypothetical protein
VNPGIAQITTTPTGTLMKNGSEYQLVLVNPQEQSGFHFTANGFIVTLEGQLRRTEFAQNFTMKLFTLKMGIPATSAVLPQTTLVYTLLDRKATTYHASFRLTLDPPVALDQLHLKWSLPQEQRVKQVDRKQVKWTQDESGWVDVDMRFPNNTGPQSEIEFQMDIGYVQGVSILGPKDVEATLASQPLGLNDTMAVPVKYGA